MMTDTFGNIAKTIDHTLLKADAKKEDIEKLCEEADRHGFASVCINPSRVSRQRNYCGYGSEGIKSLDSTTCDDDRSKSIRNKNSD